jgi:hypothetical protein
MKRRSYLLTLLCTTPTRTRHTANSTLLPNQTTWKRPQKLPFHPLRKPPSTGSTTPAPVTFFLHLFLTSAQQHSEKPSVTQFLCSLHSRGTLRLSSLPFLLSFCLFFMIQLFSLSEPSNNHQGALPQHALQLVHHHQPHSDAATTRNFSTAESGILSTASKIIHGDLFLFHQTSSEHTWFFDRKAKFLSATVYSKAEPTFRKATKSHSSSK